MLLQVPIRTILVTSARNAPTDAGFKDQKNFITYGGVSGYSRIESNGLPFGGAGVSIGGGYGAGGGLGGLGGTGDGVGGGVGGGVGSGIGGGSGVVPFP